MIRLIYIYVLFVCLNSDVFTQNKTILQEDNIGIEISKSDFDSLLLFCCKSINKNELTTEVYLSIIRIVNTIEEDNLDDCSNIIFEYLKNNFELIVEKIGGELSIGGSYYSKDFNIYIGGKPHKNSHYWIIDER